VNIPKNGDPNENSHINDALYQYTNLTQLDIKELLKSMPDYTSYIMTNVNDMIAELFTNIGKGTYFKISERVITTNNIKELDMEKIKQMIEESFEKRLKQDYFNLLEKRSPFIYLTENYSALAIVTKALNDYNYLDKLCVTTQKQVNSFGLVLTSCLRIFKVLALILYFALSVHQLLVNLKILGYAPVIVSLFCRYQIIIFGNDNILADLFRKSFDLTFLFFVESQLKMAKAN